MSKKNTDSTMPSWEPAEICRSHPDHLDLNLKKYQFGPEGPWIGCHGTRSNSPPIPANSPSSACKILTPAERGEGTKGGYIWQNEILTNAAPIFDGHSTPTINNWETGARTGNRQSVQIIPNNTRPHSRVPRGSCSTSIQIFSASTRLERTF